MRRFLKNNGLAISMFGLFLGALVPMSIVGHHANNSNLAEHHRRRIGYVAYLKSGDFIEGVFENWESEFLQMGVYVLITAYLFQKGSPVSKPLEEPSPQDVDPGRQRYPRRPWPVRRGGLWLRLYMNSLATALFGLFVMSFVLHAIGGTTSYNQDAREHGGQTVSVFRFVTTSEFWYQSFQNWQSEFLSVGALVVLAIFLRQQGSPESKPVAAPHSQTGA
ncbi:MAG: hypothetical protein M3Q23_14005 [Actinomycetota bacterium]|nr:hypothetical protein [Actinomycetota bacterium]